MQWAHPERWVWGAAVVALAAGWVWAFRAHRQALARVADSRVAGLLAEQVDWRARRIKAALVTMSTALLVLALLGPQWGFHWQEVTRHGVDIVIALDVSKSMLAEDVRPNRLARAKLAIQELLSMLQGDRIGLVAFAGTSFVQCPLTVDYDAFALTLESLDVETIPRGGTALDRAIRDTLAVFASSAPESRVLMLITDGESHEGDPLAAAKAAAAEGVKVFAVGIGTPDGELVPVTDAQGHQTFLKDRDGRTVKSRLNEELLQSLALSTGGSYVRATPTAFGLDVLYRDHIAVMTKQKFDGQMRKQFELRFQWLLAPALLLLAWELLLSDRRRMTAR